MIKVFNKVCNYITELYYSIFLHDNE
jgi:hypothetical protein